MNTADVTALVAAVTTLVAVILGPIVQIWIARRQIRASVVSANRQAWIKSLREAIDGYLAKEARARGSNRLGHADASSIDRIEKIMRLGWRIELLLNPQEEDHSRLVTLLNTMTNTINCNDPCSPVADKNINDWRQQVVALSQTILKREWERVKRGD